MTGSSELSAGLHWASDSSSHRSSPLRRVCVFWKISVQISDKQTHLSFCAVIVLTDWRGGTRDVLD